MWHPPVDDATSERVASANGRLLGPERLRSAERASLGAVRDHDIQGPLAAAANLKRAWRDRPSAIRDGTHRRDPTIGTRSGARSGASVG